LYDLRLRIGSQHGKHLYIINNKWSDILGMPQLALIRHMYRKELPFVVLHRGGTIEAAHGSAAQPKGFATRTPAGIFDRGLDPKITKMVSFGDDS